MRAPGCVEALCGRRLRSFDARLGKVLLLLVFHGVVPASDGGSFRPS